MCSNPYAFINNYKGPFNIKPCLQAMAEVKRKVNERNEFFPRFSCELINRIELTRSEQPQVTFVNASSKILQ